MPDNYMKIKLSEEEKKVVKEFCAEKGISVSAMLRLLIFQAIKEERRNG